MSDPRDEFVAKMQGVADDVASKRQEGIERRTVAQVLRSFGAKPDKQVVRREAALIWLWTDRHNDVPVPFIAVNIRAWRWDDFLLRPRKSPVIEAFKDAADTFGCEHVGAVFHAGGCGELIVHNSYDAAEHIDGGGDAIKLFSPEHLYIQKFTSFLIWLKGVWRPTGYPLGE